MQLLTQPCRTRLLLPDLQPQRFQNGDDSCRRFWRSGEFWFHRETRSEDKLSSEEPELMRGV